MQRKLVSLLVLMIFIVISVSGILAFFLPFSITIIGLHSLLGFLFLLIIGAHLYNNWRSLKTYLKSKSALACLIFISILSYTIILQPTPVKAMLRLSKNTGAALDKFSFSKSGISYSYSPDDSYKMKLSIQPTKTFQENLNLAIWIENQSSFHIETLYSSQSNESSALPYWSWKRSEFLRAKEEAETNKEDIDAISGATPNESFLAKDYILPNDQQYTILIEVN
ncbi:MAG: hypothetical protein NE330_06975, partial [Lentisphaeraceae bacterium]|nr:hypothetical protein [Lentisphaeraceae bacterium]